MHAKCPTDSKAPRFYGASSRQKFHLLVASQQWLEGFLFGSKYLVLLQDSDWMYSGLQGEWESGPAVSSELNGG